MALTQAGLIQCKKAGRKWVTYRPLEAKEPLPAILFLHGLGESGTDGLRQLVHGPPQAVIRNYAKWPFLILCPQKPDAKLWVTDQEHLNDILRWAEGEFDIDPHRRYLTGLSQGGNGTLVLATDLAWQFAAIAPICGWCTEAQAKELKDMPTWLFHGEADPVVPCDRSRDAAKWIEEAGGTVKLTTYPGVGHNSWDKAYYEEDLPAWFLSHNL